MGFIENADLASNFSSNRSFHHVFLVHFGLSKVAWKRKLAMASSRRPLARPRAATAQELLRLSGELQDRFGEVTVPLLIVHGGDDVICDPACAEDLYRRAASKDKTIHIYPGMWHQLVGESDEDVERVFGDIVEWLRTRAERAASSSYS